MAAVAEPRAKIDTESMVKSDPGKSEETLNISLVSIEMEGFVKLASSGAITASHFDPTGKNPLERVLGPNWATMRVLIDMKKTTFMDSSAMGWLIATNRSFKEAGGRFVIHDVPTNVRQSLDLLNIGRVITITENVEQAKAIVLGEKK